MIKIGILLFLLFLSPASKDLESLRSYYKVMGKSEESILQIQKICSESSTVPQSLKTAYAAAAEMASAKYKFSPVSKLSVFNSGKKKLESALRSDSANIEIRYIRFTIQSNAPSFLGYTKNISADKTFLMQHLKQLKNKDANLYAIIYSYLVSVAKLSVSEKTALSS